MFPLDRGLRQLSLELLVDADRKSQLESPDGSLDNNSDSSQIHSGDGGSGEEHNADLDGCIGTIIDEDQVKIGT